jgi:hypothetical protein
MLDEGCIEAHEPVAAIEVRKAKPVLKNQIAHSLSLWRFKDGAHFLNISVESRGIPKGRCCLTGDRRRCQGGFASGDVRRFVSGM